MNQTHFLENYCTTSLSYHTSMTKFIVLFGVFLDILCLSVMVPAYPELVGLYHVPERYIALSIGVYALATFLTAPILGQRSDKIWRKKPLLLCIGGTVACFVVLLLTRSYLLFLVAKIINGITWGNSSILQAVMSDISADNAERKKNFWLFGALFGSAFIIGPLIGSFLLTEGIRAVFRAGLLAASVEFFLIRFFYRETNPELNPTLSLRRNPFGVYRKYLFGKVGSKLLQSLGLIQISIVAYQAVIPLYDAFAIPTHQMGRYLAGAGLLAAINQWFFLAKFWLKRFSTRTLIVITHITALIAFGCTDTTDHRLVAVCCCPMRYLGFSRYPRACLSVRNHRSGR